MQIDISPQLRQVVEERRAELIERVAEVDETLAETFLMEEPIGELELRDAIRRATIALKFVPVFVGR